jgi:hypothetical protein
MVAVQRVYREHPLQQFRPAVPLGALFLGRAGLSTTRAADRG